MFQQRPSSRAMQHFRQVGTHSRPLPSSQNYNDGVSSSHARVIVASLCTFGNQNSLAELPPLSSRPRDNFHRRCSSVGAGLSPAPSSRPHKCRAFVNQSAIFPRKHNGRHPMFCQNCGTTNPDSGQFCSKCGSPLTAAAAVRPTTGPGAFPGGSYATPPPFDGNPRTSGKAIASLVCGIFTFFFPASIAAIILGHISLSEIRKSGGRIGGQGIATTGLVLGYLGIVIIPFILIVAAIAIPNLLRARMAANEASAVGSLRTINVAAVQYAAGYENGFPSSFQVFGYGKTIVGNCNHAGLIDRRLAGGQHSGYIFTYTPQFPNDASGRWYPRKLPRRAAPQEALPVTRSPRIPCSPARRECALSLPIKPESFAFPV